MGVVGLAGVAFGVGAFAADPTSTQSVPTGPCAPPQLGKGTGEGLNDPTQFPPTEGEFRVAMLFVEFADARGVTDPGAIHDEFIPRVADWYRTVSYGRMQLVVTPVRRWLTLPGRLRDYWTAEPERGMRAGLEQAVAAVDPEFDFAAYDALYVVLPASVSGRIGGVGVLISEDPVEVDGARIHVVAWLVADEMRTQINAFDAYVVHETGHLLGLPDLYVTGSPRTFHLWDVMTGGIGSRAGGLFAWHRWKLGWLDRSQIACLNGRRRVEAVLTPIERPGGTKAVMFRRANDAYVVEVRQRLNEDAAICRTGVLIYRVLFRAPSGTADVYLLRASSAPPLNLAICGQEAGAPFRLAPGRTTRVRVGRLQFELLRELPDGSYRVRVTRR